MKFFDKEKKAFVICPECGQKVKSKNSFCIYCGYNLLKGKEQITAPKNFCGKCGNKIEAEYSFCPKCGTKIN